MAISFRIAKHSIRPNANLVEILLDGDVVGALYPQENNILITSAHFSEKEIPKDFDGEVIEDTGENKFPPIPSIKITFNPRKYVIIGGKIQYLEE